MIIAVTGPMASGKNYICSQYEKDGWVSLDCDKVVHAAVSQCQNQIIETFGAEATRRGIELLNKDGSINRRALGAIVFSDPELLKKQENIVYPFVGKMVDQFISENTGRNIIINATVLYKTPDILNKCEKIVFVKSNLIKRLIRARKRDKMAFSKIIDRFRSQKGLLKKYEDVCGNIPIEIIRN